MGGTHPPAFLELSNGSLGSLFFCQQSDTPSKAPVSRSTTCSALCARCVRPSFILVIRASLSWGCSHCSLDPLPLRCLSNLARSDRVGFSIPAFLASCSR